MKKEPMTLLRPVSRRAFLSGAAALAAGAGRRLRGRRRLCARRREFHPGHHRRHASAGRRKRDQDRRGARNDLSPSIFLTPLDPNNFPEASPIPTRSPNFDAWKTINAQFVLTGRVGRADGGQIAAQFRLWDAATGEQVAGQQYTTDAANSRRVAHLIADAVFTRITGEKGFFDSRVVFVDESGSKDKRRKRLALMDMDGANVKYLTQGDNLVVTPRFSPNAQQIAYMSFAKAIRR